MKDERKTKKQLIEEIGKYKNTISNLRELSFNQRYKGIINISLNKTLFTPICVYGTKENIETIGKLTTTYQEMIKSRDEMIAILKDDNSQYREFIVRKALGESK